MKNIFLIVSIFLLITVTFCDDKTNNDINHLTGNCKI